jgi:hypothetical protein
MTYIPIVPNTATPPASPRTRELAGLLSQVLDEYQKAHPAVTPAEMRAAVRLAQMSVKGGNQTMGLIISLSLGLLVAGLMAGLLFFRSSGGAEGGPVLSMVIMGLIVFIGILLVLVKTISR